jgi:transposase
MILGFDVSKAEIVGVLINKRGVIKESFKVLNQKEEIERFLDDILLKHPRIIVGSEATGEYHNLLAKCCLKRKTPFYLLNPIVTKQFTRATVRKKKTDLTDSQIIAKSILQGQGQLISDSSFNPVKPLLRTASQLSQIAVSLNQMERRFKDNFPEEELIQKELKEASENIQKSIKKIRTQALEKIDPKLQSLLCSIPGIGEILAGVFITEIGDIKRFSLAKSLIAYAGLDPKIRQSGYTLKRNTHLTKRGSPYLRRASYIAASIAQRYDIELKNYYEKKRLEGKRYKEATIANARHILNRIYAVWTRGTPYLKHPAKITTLSISQKALTTDYRSRTCFSGRKPYCL